jgi:hypothetical protein
MRNITAKFLAGSSLIGMVLTGFSWSNATLAADGLEEAFKNGTVNGNIRVHYNERHYSDSRPDATAFALGGALRAETGPMGWTRVGVGFYTAQDLGFNNSDPARVDGRMGSEVEVLGEAYVNFSAWDSSLTVGRQKIVTPFANPIDVFIIPFTFEGVSFKNTSIPNLTLELDYINTIKSAGSDEFVDVGLWSTGRLGVATTETSGTLMLGGVYRNQGMAIHGWFYDFADLFISRYLQADYTFASLPLKPFVSAQIISQSDAGEALLGPVDTMLYGLQGGVSIEKAKLMLGYTHVAENADAFNNGAFLAPYNFSTSPLYTNSMLQNMENVDSGDGVKLTFLYSFPSVEAKLSYAKLDFNTIADLDATDVDVTYNLGNYIKGLSLRYRVEFVSSDSDAVSQSDHRLQLQYLF